MTDSKSNLQIYIVDGVKYPCHTNIINALKRTGFEILLSEDNSDAVKVRQWLRENRREDDNQVAGWIGHLWMISELMKNAKDRKITKWELIGKRERRRKIEKVQGAIHKLINELNNDVLGEIPKVFDLLDSWKIFTSMDVSLLIHQAAREDNTKPIYQETVQDVLARLSDSMERKIKCSGQTQERLNVGKPKARRLAREIALYLSREYQPKVMPDEIIASCINLTFPNMEIAVSGKNVNGWLS